MKNKLIISSLAGLLIFSCVSNQKINSNVNSVNTEKSFSDRSIAEESSSQYLQSLFQEVESGRAIDETLDVAKASCSIGDGAECILNKKADEISQKDIMSTASAPNIPITKASLILDNDKSFYTKLKAIRNAKKNIRMVYFIYSNDDSSSVLTQELIKKAQSGVKVKLLVDFITNFKFYDLFKYMENQGKGNIDIRFYNFPAQRILEDAVYTTLPCPEASSSPSSKECYDSKMKLIQKKNLTSTEFSQLFLTGLYGKSATALKLSLGMGAQVSKEDFKSSDDSIDPETMKDFFQLLFDAAIKNEFLAKVKLQFAMITHGKQINPILNEIIGRLPIINDSKPLFGSRKITHGEEWDHLTDYIHHKLLVVDGHEFQLGGRNIEDSYHMKKRISPTGKYLFKDTDFHAYTTDGGAIQVEETFDRLFNFETMVANLKKVETYLNPDYLANMDPVVSASQDCADTIKRGELKPTSAGYCIHQMYDSQPGYISAEDRYAVIEQDMKKSAQRYLAVFPKMLSDVEPTEYFKDTWNLKAAGFQDDLSLSDVKSAQFYYLENLPFDKDRKKLRRQAGSVFKKDDKYDKNIHLMWYKQLENACHISQIEKRQVRVIFNNAYLLLPSGLTYTLGKMMNGAFGDCSKVKITFLTNSFNTSDLNVINILARYQMSMLFKYQQALVDKKSNKRWFPQIELYEYYSKTMGSEYSLHTKLALFDTNFIIGSANLDVRSYYMDTNNAIMINNAPDLSSKYISFIEDLMADPSKTTRQNEMLLSYYTDSKDKHSQSDINIEDENRLILQGIINYFAEKRNAKLRAAGQPEKDGFSFITPERFDSILKVVNTMGTHVSYNTYKLLTFKGNKNYVDMLAESENLDSETKGRIRKISNEFNNMFKVL